MDSNLFLKGAIIGISVAAPVGPIGILCINRTLIDGFVHGLISGLGAATADLIYGTIVAFGLTAISTFLLSAQIPIRIIGIIFIAYLGMKNLFKKRIGNDISLKSDKGIRVYATTFFLTFTNPLTILFFVGVMTGIGVVQNRGSYLSGLSIILGIFFGSLIWWMILSGITAIVRTRISGNSITLINRLSGIVLLGFSIYLTVSFIFGDVLVDGSH